MARLSREHGLGLLRVSACAAAAALLHLLVLTMFDSTAEAAAPSVGSRAVSVRTLPGDLPSAQASMPAMGSTTVRKSPTESGSSLPARLPSVRPAEPVPA